jgi:curved DNA-binding protein
MEFQDYYELLEVPKDASASELKKAFRKLARKYHPDVAEDKSTAEEKFKKINEAYEVLSDPEKRSKYDQLGENWDGRKGYPGGGGGGFPGGGGGMEGFDFGGTGFSDFFETFFGGGGGGGHPFGGQMGGMGGGQQRARKGSDIEGRIMVTLTEVNEGSVREITLSRPDGGARESLKVKVPKGVEDGSKLRVSGRGNPGLGGGPAGDLYLVISIARHPDFELEGSDLVHECELAPHELVLGTTISVPTLSGRVKLKVAECSQPGDRLRLGGRGLAKAGGDSGDLYVELVAKFPEELSDADRAKWDAFE